MRASASLAPKKIASSTRSGSGRGTHRKDAAGSRSTRAHAAARRRKRRGGGAGEGGGEGGRQGVGGGVVVGRESSDQPVHCPFRIEHHGQQLALHLHAVAREQVRIQAPWLVAEIADPERVREPAGW